MLSNSTLTFPKKKALVQKIGKNNEFSTKKNLWGDNLVSLILIKFSTCRNKKNQNNTNKSTTQIKRKNANLRKDYVSIQRWKSSKIKFFSKENANRK